MADGDDSDSQLSLASQPSQSEPDVVLPISPRPTTCVSTLHSPTSPSVSVPPVPHTVSPKSLSLQDPTFPPARYILRPSRNRSPPPYPASPLPPMQIQHSHASSEPLPLSAVVRPDLSMARRVGRPRKTSFTQQSVPAQVSVQSNQSYPASCVAPPHSTEVAVASQCVCSHSTNSTA